MKVGTPPSSPIPSPISSMPDSPNLAPPLLLWIPSSQSIAAALCGVRCEMWVPPLFFLFLFFLFWVFLLFSAADLNWSGNVGDWWIWSCAVGEKAWFLSGKMKSCGAWARAGMSWPVSGVVHVLWRFWSVYVCYLAFGVLCTVLLAFCSLGLLVADFEVRMLQCRWS